MNNQLCQIIKVTKNPENHNLASSLQTLHPHFATLVKRKSIRMVMQGKLFSIDELSLYMVPVFVYVFTFPGEIPFFARILR